MPAAAWDWAKKFGKAISMDKAIAAVLALKDQAFDLAKKGFVFIKDKVLPLVEKLRQARNDGDELHDRRHPVQGRRATRTRDSSRKGGEDLQGALDIATDVIPVVSTVKDTCTGRVGENFVTNQTGRRGASRAWRGACRAGHRGLRRTCVHRRRLAAAAIGVRTAVEGGLKGGGKLLAKEAAEALAKKAAREAAEKVLKEAAEKALKEAAEKAAREAVERAAKEPAEKAAREAAERAVGKPPRKPRRSGGTIGEGGGGESSEGRSGESSKRGRRAVGERGRGEDS